jgi:hypothetical protein
MKSLSTVYSLCFIISGLVLSNATHAQTNSFSLYSSGAYSGGTSDMTNVSTPQLKLQSTSGYIRVPHISADGNTSAVYNFETGKNVYWGESTDAGNYLFRGRNMYVTEGGMGIGTTSPGTRVEIMTTSTADGLQLRYNATTGFVRLTASNFVASYLNPIVLSGDAGLIFGKNTVDSITTGLVIAPFRSTLGGLRIDNNGNVGIKTNNTQGYCLAVNGSAIFTSARVKAYNNWPDFVLGDDYQLVPLDSLSRYIQIYRHLPDMPSADNIRAVGIDLGDTDAALLKKVEELTLYVIDQNKILETQQKEIEALKIMVLAKKNN